MSLNNTALWKEQIAAMKATAGDREAIL